MGMRSEGVDLATVGSRVGRPRGWWAGGWWIVGWRAVWLVGCVIDGPCGRWVVWLAGRVVGKPRASRAAWLVGRVAGGPRSLAGRVADGPRCWRCAVGKAQLAGRVVGGPRGGRATWLVGCVSVFVVGGPRARFGTVAHDRPCHARSLLHTF